MWKRPSSTLFDCSSPVAALSEIDALNLRPACRFLGRLTILLAATELAPVVCSFFFDELDIGLAFLISALITAVFGAVLIALGRKGGELYRREGILIVVGGWVLASLFGALPYLLSGTFVLPVDALFESASGFTTTGA